MKPAQILAAAAAALFPGLTSAQAVWGWSIENVPEAGITDITFPMGVSGSAHEQHYYYANQFSFVNQEHVGYTGLQPQGDAEDGSSQIRGVFSSFIDGTTTSDELCSEGADGGPGVSCGFVFKGDYESVYNIVIKNTADTTWTGTAVDTASGNEHHLGTWTLPSGSGGITSGGRNMGCKLNYGSKPIHSPSPGAPKILGLTILPSQLLRITLGWTHVTKCLSAAPSSATRPPRRWMSKVLSASPTSPALVLATQRTGLPSAMTLTTAGS